MDGDEEVGLVVVGDVGACVERNEHIRFSGVDHLDIGTVALHVASEGQCHVEVDVLLLREGADGSCIVSAVSSINDQREAVGGNGLQGCRYYKYKE